jgi:hypothetical protein
MATLNYADKEKLIELNIKAINTKRNRSSDPELLEEALNTTQLYPVIFSMIHNDKEMRVAFSVGGSFVWVDMDFEDYLNLPELSILD